MANSSRRPRLRPQLYVHVEFGVSWTPDRPPRNHQVTYRSRGLQERLPVFPRHVPAPNTNYLTAAQTDPPVPYDWDLYNGYYAPPLRQPEERREVQQHETVEPRPSARSESRSSHERGQSAPPPLGNNPWDISVPPIQSSGVPTASDGRTASNPPQVWKALPEAPPRFGLGQDGLPWSGSVPYGYDPEVHPQDDEYHQPSSTISGPSGSNVVSATSPTEVSVFSPGPFGQSYHRPEDPGRAHELGALGAALMTVDNGFENQWWYQGQREAVTTGEIVGETVLNPQRFSQNSLGWAVASNTSGRYDRLSVSTTDVSSPLPAFIGPDPSFQPPLTRSLSTRSDELFFTERSRTALPA